MERVKVVIPVYKSSLTEHEAASLKNTVQVLGSYPIVLLRQEGLDVSAFTAYCPAAEIISVSDEWLGRKNGIMGYNRMMLSAGFYDLFSDCQYILICHLDAWIFRDELSAWCDADYDCVAAPWIRRRIYDLPIIKQYMDIKKCLYRNTGKVVKMDIYNKIGNGGLSLRRVAAFRDACIEYSDEAKHFLTMERHLFNEDVFWALVPRKFRYPSLETALQFAFDTNPSYCYNHCGKKLPFGCHSWSKPRMYRFWAAIIDPLVAGTCKKAD